MGKEALLGPPVREIGGAGVCLDAAWEARHRAFGNKVFLYGFLYLSTIAGMTALCPVPEEHHP